MTRNLPYTLLAALYLLLSATVAPGQKPSLAQQIATLVNDPTVYRAHWGIMVTTLDGKPLYSLNEAQFFQPASNAKLFTTAAAMALLGTQQRFTTRVEYAPIFAKTKTVLGDLVIVGAGDGNFGDQELPYQPSSLKASRPPKVQPPLHLLTQFADQIAATGVSRITGDIVGDDTLFPWEPYPQDWSIDDMVWGYGAPVSALTINESQLQLVIHPGKNTQDLPTVDMLHGFPAYYRIDSGSLVTTAPKTGNHVAIERAVGSRVIRISGSIATDAPAQTEEIAIDDPAEFAAIALREMLEIRGVKVDGVARARHREASEAKGFLESSREPLPQLPKEAMNNAVSTLLTGKVSCQDACPAALEHTSPTIEEDVVLTNKVSQNLHAELLLHHLAKVYGADASTAQGARVVRQFLLNAGLDKDDFVFYDGSGLSGHDLVTPRASAKLLAYATTQPWFVAWKASLPIGGIDGSLTNRFKDAPLKGHVFAKTGTLGEARALSGYLDCASGKTVIFSIMDSAHPPGSNVDREIMDRIVAAIAAAN